MRVYVDTSALAKLLQEEPESSAFTDFVCDPKWHIYSGDLIETEIRRTAQRLEKPQSEAKEALEKIDVVEVRRADFRTAGVIEARNLRSLDAIHLAVALATEADFICSYDTRMVEAALYMGIPVLRPGFEPENPA